MTAVTPWLTGLGLIDIGLTRLFAAVAVIAIGMMPAAAGAVSPERFLGTWHEVARIEPLFERGLIRVQATYGKLPDADFGPQPRL